MSSMRLVSFHNFFPPHQYPHCSLATGVKGVKLDTFLGTDHFRAFVSVRRLLVLATLLVLEAAYFGKRGKVQIPFVILAFYISCRFWLLDYPFAFSAFCICFLVMLVCGMELSRVIGIGIVLVCGRARGLRGMNKIIYARALLRLMMR